MPPCFSILSVNANITNEQAGCMVAKVGSDPSLAERLMSTLVDGAEISIAIDSDAELEQDTLVQASFVRFANFDQKDCK
jgi:type II secretory pathway predicted ATPase ExeA